MYTGKVRAAGLQVNDPSDQLEHFVRVNPIRAWGAFLRYNLEVLQMSQGEPLWEIMDLGDNVEQLNCRLQTASGAGRAAI